MTPDRLAALGRDLVARLLLDPSPLAEVLAVVPPSTLIHPRHRAVVEWMISRAERSLPHHAEALLLWAADQDTLREPYGPWGELVAVTGDVPVLEAVYLARQYRAAWMRLEVARLSAEIAAQDARHPDLEDWTSAVVGKMRRLEATLVEARRDTEDAADVAFRVHQELAAAFERPAYIATGIERWDTSEDFTGLSCEGVTLILGASGMGKTSVLNRLALGMCATGTPVYLHGTETSTERRWKDLVLGLAGTNVRALARMHSEGRDHELATTEYRLDEWTAAASRLGLTLSGAGLTVEQVCMRARDLHRRGRCAAIVVDYLQDFSPSRAPGLTSEQSAQVRHASRVLKDLAAELRIPVVVGAQVSGEKEGPKQDPRPQMWDAQWSSGAHQDAEEVYALFRGDYYRDRKIQVSPPGVPDAIEVIARKRRTGKLSTLVLPFHGPSKWVGEPLRLDFRGVAPRRTA